VLIAVSRILVAYGSKHGATAEIAEHMRDAFRGEGHESDAIAAGDVTDLEAYDAVIVGSAVYQGRWRPEARTLLKRLRRGLDGRALWLFSSGPLADTELDPADRWQFPKGVRKAGERLGARDPVVFRGRVPPDPTNFMERAMLKGTAEEDRDARDFEAIAKWATGVAAELDR
jgi:menaquinone-dependent protoporphyrinogen oxidase